MKKGSQRPHWKCGGCLYRVGLGYASIAKHCRVSKKAVIKWIRLLGISEKRTSGYRWTHRSGAACGRQSAIDPILLIQLKIKREAEQLIMSAYRIERKAAAMPDRLWENQSWIKIASKVAYQKRKRLTDPVFRAKFYARKRITNAIKYYLDKRKDFSASKALHCSGKKLVEHLERQFKPGMNWDNHGVAWHIDHLIPLSSAKTMRQMEKLCHYSNLQPLWASENWKKGNKIMTQQAMSI